MRKLACVLMLGVLAVAGLAGCGSDDGEEPSPQDGNDTPQASPNPEQSPAASATEAVSPQPTSSEDPGSSTGWNATAPDGFTCNELPEACQFAHQLEGWLLAGDAEAFLAHIHFEAITCPADLNKVGAPTLLCEDAETGEVRNGFLIRNPGHGAYVGEDDVREDFEHIAALPAVAHEDAYGPGSLRLALVGCPVDNATRRLLTNDRCRERFAVVLSYIDPTSGRSFALYEVERPENAGDLIIVASEVATGPDAEKLAAVILGGETRSDVPPAPAFDDYMYFDPTDGEPS